MEHFVVDLPWGADAVSDVVKFDEIQIVLLQQNIISSLGDRIDSLSAELKGKDIWYSSSLSANQKLREKVAVLQDEIEALSIQLSKYGVNGVDAQAHADAVAHLTAELDAANVRLAAITLDLNTASEQVSAVTDERDTLANELESLRSRNMELTAMAHSSSRADEEIGQLKARLNEAQQLIANHQMLLAQQEEAVERAATLCRDETARTQEAEGMAVKMSAMVKREREQKAVLVSAIAAFSFEPILKIEGKGQLHLMQGYDVGVFSPMKELVGCGGPLWMWVETSGYGHPVGLTSDGDLVTGEKSSDYFKRRIGKAAREQLIDTMLQFDSAYFEKLQGLINDTHRLIAVRGTTMPEEAIEFIRGLELIPAKERAQAQLDQLQMNLIMLHKATERASVRFQARVKAVQPGQAGSKGKKKRK